MVEQSRIAVDIGGTFTDVTVMNVATGAVRFGKALSTPADLADGVFAAIERAGGVPATAEFVIHGSTIAINAILERKGAETALITTEGFRDVYEIGRINRPDSFNLFFRKHVPLVARDRIFEVPERMRHDGSVWTPFDAVAAGALARTLVEERIEAVAIVFLHSYANVAHEEAMRAILLAANPNLFVTASHDVSREYREYERTSTTVANAYVGPRVSRYLEGLEARLSANAFGGELLIMQSSGGLCDVATAKSQCIQMLESGPAAGVVGASVLAEAFGTKDLICFDMGGTTAKACVLQDGIANLSPDFFVGGYNEGLAIRIPVLDIKEVGTGGGSIAWIDEAGGLHVGPGSAGASPGPACYSLGGTQPTVTDAHLALGRLSPERFADGRLRLDVAAAEGAIRTHVAEPLGIDVAAAAEGIIAIATTQMANAVRTVSTERGLDPRDFVLIAYGGAGPMQAVDVARELAIRDVVIPLAPGHFSAYGMLTADLRREYARTFVAPLAAELLATAIAHLYDDLAAEAAAWLTSTGLVAEAVTFERAADVRYQGQEHAVTIPIATALDAADAERTIKDVFDARYLQRYGHSAPEEPAEFVAARVSIVGRLAKPLPQTLPSDGTDLAAALIERRPVRFGAGAPVASAIYDRARLGAGALVTGPAMIEEAGSLTCLPPGVTATVNPFGHLFLTVDEA
ncbi:MAG TPA: hydantoinase/oxoprolinase family protein [Candidatus Lustribacter sp.]|jgi:N-methylhydantoinase A|nr:hydantoinase/oxoprolinase family protein [Candidatus Lustribacter sp.]